MTAGSSELEKVGSIFLQVNLPHHRVQLVGHLRNKLQPGMWEALAGRGRRGKLGLTGMGSVTASSVSKRADMLLFVSPLKT